MSIDEILIKLLSFILVILLLQIVFEFFIRLGTKLNFKKNTKKFKEVNLSFYKNLNIKLAA
ncbi:hypothetical protein [Pseudoalteromonas sp. MTN2-4]|uniref:hypothetical protein n=1 Tax=Pseudoalteromonas sp. MTN2-4 TaxID=3056555 RepID=UPI0036F30DB7